MSNEIKIVVKTAQIVEGNPEYSAGLAAIIDGIQEANGDMIAGNLRRTGSTTETAGAFTVVSKVSPTALPPADANTVVADGGTVVDYTVKRYVKVVDLADDLDSNLPDSVWTDPEGILPDRPLTYQEIQDLPTVETSPRVDGLFYFDCTAQSAHRNLTLDEYNLIILDGTPVLLEADELPDYPPTTP